MNIKLWKMIVVLTLSSVVIGCASNENSFDQSLYSGKPVDSLTNDEPPETEEEALQRGDAALSQGNYDLAMYEYIRSLEFEEAVMQSETLYTIGRIHYSKQNLDIAERAFIKSVEFDPNNTKALEQLGVLFSKQGNIEQGRVFFFRAVNADQVRLNSGKIILKYEDVDQDNLAALLYDEQSPAKSYMGLGILADVDKQHDLAKRFYEKSLEINPKSAKSLINLGYSHYMSENYHLAKRLTKQALIIDPKNEKALNNLALIHIALDEISYALNVFMQQMSAPEALNNVGYFLILQGKPSQAIPYLEQAINNRSSYYETANQNLERALLQVRLSLSEVDDEDTKG